MDSTNKKEYLIFDETNDSIEAVYRSSYDIFILLKNQLAIYENEYYKNKTVKTKMKIPSNDEIVTPKLGNLLMQLLGSSEYNKETINQLSKLYNDDSCSCIMKNEIDYNICSQFWSGILLKGMEQSITQIGVVINSVLDELNSLNEGNIPFKDLLEGTSFIKFEEFIESYLLLSYYQTDIIFSSLRTDKLKGINTTFTLILLIYIIISVVLFVILFYFIFSSKYIFNSFLNFIGIVPTKYLLEDEKLFKEILKLDEDFF